MTTKWLLLHPLAAKRFGKRLATYGFTVVPLSPSPALNPIVAAHADTLFCAGVADRPIVNRAYAQQFLPKLLQSFLLTSDDPHGSYPTDVAFQALPFGDMLFAREASLAPSIKAAATASHFQLIPVKQGYVRCSVVALPAQRAAITADSGIAAAMEAHGIDTLRISPGSIALDGCEYGFLGGASFVDTAYETQRGDPTVYFFGELNEHPEHRAIVKFLAAHRCRAVSLGGTLTDYGGAVLLENHPQHPEAL